MNRKFLAPLAVGFLALPGAAFADDREEIALFQTAQQSLGAAIARAEQETGGKAVEAEFDEERGVGLWEIGTVHDTARFKVGIDAISGQIVHKSERRTTTPAPQPAHVLADLVTKAEAAGNGKVMSIDPEHHKGEMIGYEVEILGTDGRVSEYLLNPADGTLAAKPRHDH
ncbi:PepSY domain-containing protein [Paenirhodobacter sp.]|uniref:PepSY domain-containing protein n=1 Tax=Paenirhodobacter sp. TaxID=1965326 RepID=UPI003B3C7950